jgi:hypothetical protein
MESIVQDAVAYFHNIRKDLLLNLSLAALERYLRTDDNPFTLTSFTLTSSNRRDNIRHTVVILGKAKLVLVLIFESVYPLGALGPRTTTPSPSNQTWC